VRMKMKMKTVESSVRFTVGDMVSWKSRLGNEYVGVVVSIKQSATDDLIIVRLPNGQHRSFYDNATDYTIIE